MNAVRLWASYGIYFCFPQMLASFDVHFALRVLDRAARGEIPRPSCRGEDRLDREEPKGARDAEQSRREQKKAEENNRYGS